MLHTRNCIVIGLEKGTERFSRVQLFSDEAGYLQALRRKSTRRAGTLQLDLFQSVEVVLEQKAGYELSFLKECNIVLERQTIATHYAAFDCACRFCRAIQLNAGHMEHPESIFQLLAQSLDAWNEKPLPHATLLKALFKLASQEGFPVRERWLPQHNNTEVATIRILLGQPLQSLSIPDSHAKELAEDLTNWLSSQQDFLF
jgi:recombinational DNA repair protein (RecF pathway)